MSVVRHGMIILLRIVSQNKSKPDCLNDLQLDDIIDIVATRDANGLALGSFGASKEHCESVVLHVI